MQEPSNDIQATVTRYTAINDLTFTFFDSIGNEVSTDQPKNWDMTITLLGHEDRVVKKLKVSSLNGSVSLPMDRIFAEEDEMEKNSDAVLLINSCYKLKDKFIYLRGGIIKLKRVLLNNVSSIDISVIKEIKTNKRKKIGRSYGARVHDDDFDDRDGENSMHQNE